MGKETLNLKKGALQLVDDKAYANVKFAEGDTAKTSPELDMLAYSGGVITDHWYWGNLVIDLEGMSFPKKKFPVLEDHDTDKKIGFATKMAIVNHQLIVESSEFIDTPESIKFRENSAQGFPYEASIYARPTKIQRLMENESATVNGFELAGPATIWRKSNFKETSVVTFGYDSKTRSAAMKEGDGEDFEVFVEQGDKFKNEEEVITMDYLKFKTDHPEEYKKIVDLVQGECTVKFTEEKGILEAQITTLTVQNTKLSEENQGNESRLQSLEKAEMIRGEAALKHTADTEFNSQFSAAGIPARLAPKIRNLVNHEKFMKDGVLDKEAFSAAVKTELADWVPTSENEGSVLGLGASTKSNIDSDVEMTAEQLKESDAVAARMIASVNFK